MGGLAQIFIICFVSYPKTTLISIFGFFAILSWIFESINKSDERAQEEWENTREERNRQYELKKQRLAQEQFAELLKYNPQLKKVIDKME